VFGFESLKSTNSRKHEIIEKAASDKVYQLLAHGRWFYPGTPASSTNKTGRHDITEILLKVALTTKNKKKIIINQFSRFSIISCFLEFVDFKLSKPNT
jgi:hypothetical protein